MNQEKKERLIKFVQINKNDRAALTFHPNGFNKNRVHRGIRMKIIFAKAETISKGSWLRV